MLILSLITVDKDNVCWALATVTSDWLWL